MGFTGTARAVALAVLVLSGALAALVPPSAEAQGGSAPWYGPADRSRPTEGWSFRVPVVVENDRDYVIEHDLVVHATLDFGKLLVRAGWINQTTGVETLPRGFTLDPDSIRVVEYERGFRDFRAKSSAGEPLLTPHLFYPSLFDQTTRGADYHPTNRPIGTVTWTVKAPFAVEERRFYYVYFNALQYGKTVPAEHREFDMAPLEALGWSGAGQVFYGREVGAAGNVNRLDIFATYPDTTVTFYTYYLGQPRLYEPPPGSATLKNPLVLNNQTNGPRFSYTLPQNEFFKIVADKPINVFSRGALRTPGTGESFTAGYGAGGFAVGENGQYRSARFTIPVYAGQLWAYATESGSTTVNVDGTSFQLSTSQPARIVKDGQVDGTGGVDWSSITATKPILLQYVGAREVRHTMQAPAISGAPTGTGFYSLDVNEDRVYIRALDPAGVRLYHPDSPATQVFPSGQTGVTPAHQMTPGCAGARDLRVNQTFQQNSPFTVRAEAPASGGKAGHLALLTGGPANAPTGYYGGKGGQRVIVQGPAAIVAHFNETRMKITECRASARQTGVAESTVLLNADGLYQLQGERPDPTNLEFTLKGAYEIVSNKPIAVFSTLATDHYARVVPGRALPPRMEVGAVEFRGHLVDIRSADQSTLQPYKTTGPNVPVDFRLTALNLGRWIGGENLPDTVRITCTSDRPTWEIKGCDRELKLNSNSLETFPVTVVPLEAPPNDRGTITVTASSSGARNITASILLIVRVEVTYGVGTWFDVENGLKLIDPPVSLNPGETHTYRVVVKNTGSVEDTFTLERVPRALPEGWTARLVRQANDAEETTRLTLLPGESDTLRLVVTAPAELTTFTPKFFDTTIKATSLASASATDKVTAQTRIRAEIQFELTVDERTKLAPPGMPANFTLSLLNRGNDIARIALAREGVLPPGWDARILDPSGAELSEINLGLGPPFNATLAVTPPADARAGDIATARIAAETTVGEETRREEVSATVVVRQVHNVTIPEPAELTAVPGDVLRYVLDLTNVGNGDEVVELVRSSLRPAWRIAGVNGDGVEVPRGASADLEVALTVPEATPAGFYEVNFTLRLNREADRPVTLPVVVQTVRQLAITAPAPIRLSPGQEFEFPVDVRNTGNVRDVATLLAELPSGWSARFEPATVLVAPGDGTRVRMFINASRDAADGELPIAFAATFANSDERSRSAATATVARPDLRLGAPLAEGSPRRGEVLLVTVPVTNLGTMEAQDVRVALVVDGETVSIVSLGRILPGEQNARSATLTWTVDRPVRDVKVVVNPDGTIVEPDGATADKEAAVSFARTVPDLGALGALAALGVALLAARRWRR